MKETQITDCCNRIIKWINIKDLSNVQYRKFQIDDSIIKEKYPLLHFLHIPFISHMMPTILYEIIKLSEQFPNINIVSLKHWRGVESIVIHIPK